MKVAVRLIVAVQLILPGLLVPSAMSQGTIIFNNFGANDRYDRGSAAGLTFMMERAALPFTPNISGTLSSVELPLFLLSGINAADVSVRTTDPATGFPGAAVEAFSVRGGVRESLSPDTGPTKYESSLRPVLSMGTQYWLEVASVENASLLWYSAGLGGEMPGYLRSMGQEVSHVFSPPPAFRITVDVIPEPPPGAILLVGVAIIGVVSVSRLHSGKSNRDF